MKITERKLKELKKFKTASFAIWSKDLTDTTIIEKNISKLHARIIILGLNPSAKITPFENFHCGRYDHWYAEAFGGAEPFAGAYMTDLISESQPSSAVIVRKWRENRIGFRDKNIRKLFEQFKILGIKNPHVVCIGKNTHKLLCEANIPTGKVWYLKHPNSYRMHGARRAFISDVKKLARKMKS